MHDPLTLSSPQGRRLAEEGQLAGQIVQNTAALLDERAERNAELIPKLTAGKNKRGMEAQLNLNSHTAKSYRRTAVRKGVEDRGVGKQMYRSNVNDVN